MKLQTAESGPRFHCLFSYLLVFAMVTQSTAQLSLALPGPIQTRQAVTQEPPDQNPETSAEPPRTQEQPNQNGSTNSQQGKSPKTKTSPAKSDKTPGDKSGGGQSPKKPPALTACSTDAGAESLPPITVKPEADRWGVMTVAQPKIWEYERVNSLLDGLLRDVEGISLADLTGLNPNTQNAAALKFIQSALEAGVQFDQASAVNAKNTLQNFQIQHQSDVQKLDQFNSFVNGLVQQRSVLTQQLFAANATVVRLQARQDAGAAMSADEIAQLAEAKSQATALQSQITSINTMISNAGPAPTLTAPPTVQGTTVQSPLSGAPVSTLSSFSDVIKALPQGVQNNLSSALQSPSYPATKQLENFITLLHERLAQEISVLQDDLVRDPNNLAYLMQFDVGLYPSDKTKNHMARVAFQLNCPGCRVYSLYPGESSYNVANYQGSSRRKTFWGNAATLIGLGLTAAYRHQTDTLQGSLVQSVYVSGFQEGGASDFKDAPNVGQRFGWYYNAAPFDQYVTPGIRSTFALITIPRALVQGVGTSSGACLPVQVEMDWAKRDNPMYQRSHWYVHQQRLTDNLSTFRKESLSVKLPGSEYLPVLPRVVERQRDRLHVVRMEYNTLYYAPPPPVSASPTGPPGPNAPPVVTGVPAAPSVSAPVPAPDPFTGCPRGQCAAILLSLDVPIDPNLVISVKGRPLERIRDWRGRATSILPPVQSASDITTPLGSQAGGNPKVIPAPGLLEADQLQPNTWFAINSHDLILNVSHDLVGEGSFPTIQISDPAKRTLLIPDDLRQDETQIIQNGFSLNELNSEEMAARYAAVRLRTVDDWKKNSLPSQNALPLMSGPYPYSTFLPLFEFQPAHKRFYAYLGEAGDLLIGFLGDPEGGTVDPDSYVSWVESRVQVILEDRDLPFAWSLSCTGQGSQLACTLPVDEIRKSYSSLLSECNTDTDCFALNQSAGFVARTLDKHGVLALKNQAKQEAKLEVLDSGIKKMTGLYWPNLQVWVHQYDPSGKNAFNSPEPAPLGLFPLWDFSSDPQKSFRPWHFSSATNDEVLVGECNFFGSGQAGKVSVSLLTAPAVTPIVFRPQEDSQTGCATVNLPKYILMRGNAVLRISADDNPGVHWITSIPSAQLRPQLRRPVVQVVRDTKAPFRVKSWIIDIPIPRASCHDALDHVKELHDAGIQSEWLDGDQHVDDTSCSSLERSGQWWQDANLEETLLRLEVPKSAFRSLLPTEIHLIRIGTAKSRGVVQLATLPDLRKLLLPDKLTLVALGKNQFGLRGKNAAAIDAVTLQSSGKGYTYTVVASVDFAPVSLSSTALLPPPPASQPAPSKKGAKPKPVTPGSAKPAPAKPTAAKPAITPAVFKPTDFARFVLVDQTSAGQPGSASQTGNNSGSSGQNSTGQTNKTPPPTTKKKVSNANQAQSAPKPDLGIPTPGTYTVLPLFLTDDGLKDWSKLAPIDVTDAQGNGLIFTQPDTAAATPAAATQPTTKTEVIEKKTTTTTTNTGQQSH